MQQPYPQAQPFPNVAQQASWPPPAKSKGMPIWGLIFAIGAFFLGVLGFLIAGFRGHSAGWEMLAGPTAMATLCALIGFAGGIVSFTRKSILGALALLALSGLGGLLALVGFVLGA